MKTWLRRTAPIAALLLVAGCPSGNNGDDNPPTTGGDTSTTQPVGPTGPALPQCPQGQVPDANGTCSTSTTPNTTANGSTTCATGQVEEAGRCVKDGPNPCPNNELDGCYAKHQMQRFYFHVLIPFGKQFLKDTYKTMEPPADHWYIPTGREHAGKCTNKATQDSYEYCPADGIVYLGQEELWSYYNGVDDIAAILMFIHEYGHRVQHNMGALAASRPQNATAEQRRLLGIRAENQADCFAGAWLRYAKTKGILTGDDVQGVINVLPKIASVEGPARDHGTLQERRDSVVKGVNGGVWACNDYFPATPLIFN